MFGMLDELREERKRLDAKEAAWLRKVAAYDRSDDWRADGYANAANALRHACRMDPAIARGHVVLARKLEELPEVADAFATGAISRSHAELITHAYTPERAAKLSDAESAFVVAARDTEPHELRNVVRYVTDMIDGDGGAAEDDAKYARRQWYQSRTLDRMLKIDALLDPEYAEYWEKAVSAEMERDYFAADTRSPAQRRADAATNLIRQSLDHGRIGTSRAVRPHVTIVQDVRDLPGATPELLDEIRNARHRHGRLSAATIERLLCDCDVTRVITNGRSEILDVGRASRNPTAAQWKALVVRDRHCQAPGCTQPPERCQAHHIRQWTHGGPTDLDNLQLLCRHHHRQTHMHDAPARAA